MIRAKLPPIVGALLVLCSAVAAAQCPEGTPPPCRSAVLAAARRANPPMNPHGWVVVPFGNAMKARDLDWLRAGSVNLLSMDLGRWTDVDVVPDKRVGDLLRELPAKDDETLTLNQGLSIARRAGAAMLVMGDFFRIGKGARIVANVFNVRNGNRIRSVTQQVNDADSLLNAFAPLARGVLAVPPPSDAKAGEIGTHRLDAYQEYLLGVTAFHRFDLPTAEKQFRKALAIDSTFALAHYQLGVSLAWNEGASSAEVLGHMTAAQRLGVSLPNRERTLIDAQLAIEKDDYARACALAKPLVARDSTDIEALSVLGDCSYHDNVVELSPRDSNAGIFRTSWNTSIHAFSRVLELDPSYYLAFEHILDIYGAIQRPGSYCAPTKPCVILQSSVLRDGDSLITVATDPLSQAWQAQLTRARGEKPKLTNLKLARDIAVRWLTADSSSERAHFALARVELARGDLPAAETHLSRIPRRAAGNNLLPLRTMLEVAIKTGRADEARALFDSLVKAVPDNPNFAPTLAQRGAIEMTFGRFKRVDAGFAKLVAPLSPEAAAYYRMVPRAVLGLPVDGLAEAEAAYYATLKDPACNAACRYNKLAGTLAFDSRLPRPAFPKMTADHIVLLSAADAIIAGDSAKLRSAAFTLDTAARANVAMGWTEFGLAVAATDAYLQLRDSASALRMARFYVDSAMPPETLNNVNIQTGLVRLPLVPLWTRMMLLRADLAFAAGKRDEARVWYRRVLDLWSQADPEMQPTVDRIKAALASLGSS